MYAATPYGHCTFFSKMGACRHGDGCTKLHFKPTSSPTLLFPKLYPNPLAFNLKLNQDEQPMEFDKKYLKKHFEHFYKEMWRNFMELGKIAELRVVSNLCDHLLGNVYIRFEDAADAARVRDEVKAKRFHGILMLPELSPVQNFPDACCKEDLEGSCARQDQCNYLHIMKISSSVMKKLEKEQEKFYAKKEKKTGGDRKRSRSRSDSPHRLRGARPDTCHICGKTGHIARDCGMK
jgi:splicing factor U2AF subunit